MYTHSSPSLSLSNLRDKKSCWVWVPFSNFSDFWFFDHSTFFQRKKKKSFIHVYLAFWIPLGFYPKVEPLGGFYPHLLARFWGLPKWFICAIVVRSCISLLKVLNEPHAFLKWFISLTTEETRDLIGTYKLTELKNLS